MSDKKKSTKKTSKFDKNAVNSITLQKWLSLDKSQLSRMETEGLLKKKDRNIWDLEQNVIDYILHLRGIASGRTSLNGKYDLVGERARLAAMQADYQKLILDEKQKKLVQIDEVLDSLSQILNITRSKFLGLGIALAPAWTLAQSQNEAKEIIDKAVDEMMAELSNAFRKIS